MGAGSVPEKGSLEEGLECILQGSPFSSKAPCSRLGCSAESHLDFVSPSKLAVFRKQLWPISFYVNMVEDVKEIGNLEGIGQFLKEKCVIVTFFFKNYFEEKSNNHQVSVFAVQWL